jgi:hypothetical protein
MPAAVTEQDQQHSGACDNETSQLNIQQEHQCAGSQVQQHVK